LSLCQFVSLSQCLCVSQCVFFVSECVCLSLCVSLFLAELDGFVHLGKVILGTLILTFVISEALLYYFKQLLRNCHMLTDIAF